MEEQRFLNVPPAKSEQSQYIAARKPDCPVLVLEKESVAAETLRGFLTTLGYPVEVAASATEALEIVESQFCQVIFADTETLQNETQSFLSRIQGQAKSPVVILMTSLGTLEGAVQAISEGAFDYVSMPLTLEVVRPLIKRAMGHYKEILEGAKPSFPAPIRSTSLKDKVILGKSPSMVNVFRTVAKAAKSSTNIFITGESGTGKELVAYAIHENSPRKNFKFIPVNCGALTDSLLESELFGHLRGSFTGAFTNKRGLFEEANHGTIFLDEIGDISPSFQVKLLRVIQEGEFKPVGSVETKNTDVRVISATHRNLEEMVQKNEFREDLYYRLKVISLEIPPLRERLEDLDVLLEYFLEKFSRSLGKKCRLSEEALKLLYSHRWPGNVRELENTVEYAVSMSCSSVLYPEDFPQEIQSRGKGEISSIPVGEPFVFQDQTIETMEKHHIVRMLQEAEFNKSKAADLLGIDRATLYRKARRYQISLHDSITPA